MTGQGIWLTNKKTGKKFPLTSRKRKKTPVRITSTQITQNSGIKISDKKTVIFKKIITKIPISKISRELIINTILTGLSTAIANPAPILIYQIYKKSMYSYKIFQKIQNSNFINRAKIISKIGVHKFADKHIDAVATEMTMKAKETGYFKEISQRTGTHENISALFFHSSVKKGLSDGTDSLTDFVVEGVT